MSEEKNIERSDEKALQTEPVGTETAFLPQVDIIERIDGIEILADMPGVSRDNVNAILEEGVLTIEGKVTPPEEEGLSLESGEYEYGNFHRSFAVGEGLNPDGIEAGMKDGVLRLTVPKSEKYKPKQIQIK